ncbi:MAG: Slp family lipoprotein [Desulfobacteraceae bacterium]|nr:MAG: Slp family lipoprotein [Desulfobacteraceae bacterium]
MRYSKDWHKSGQTIASLLLLSLIYSALTACAPALSKQFREKALPPVSYNELLSDPNKHKGRNIILGGYVLEVKNESDGSQLTMLQAPLDFQNRPHSRDKSKGRFLARTDKFIDPEIYKKERKLTVGGTVAGVSAQPLGDRIYRYPVIEVEELYLWAEETRQDWPYDPYYDPYRDHWGYPWYFYHRPIRPYHRR